MQDYGVRDVERLLRLSRSTLRVLVDAGFVRPTRGPRNSLRFSFQDLIVLRTAKALVDAKVPQRRITRSVRELRRHLPDTMPLSGLSISAVADRVVVREGTSRWQAESGQYLLEFGADPVGGGLRLVEPGPAAPPTDAHEFFELGVALEDRDPQAAVDAYERAIATDPGRLDARINLGRLLHEARSFAKAERVYREALKAGVRDPLLLFNLGVLLEDMDRRADAVRAYEAALAADPSLADCHYNLALLYEKLKRPKDAIRHMSQYRRLAS